jgi:selenide,water dikinase
VLKELLAGLPSGSVFPNLMVGVETGDDAAVYRLNDEQAVVATTDFFTPIVDDPTDFGRIAAANALSDVYATGGTPIMALAICGIPANKLPIETARKILAGGATVCAEVGIPIAGGHTVDAAEPFYGLAAMGIVHPDRVMRNSTARAGDVLVLGKPLGIGILGAALNKDELDPAGYRELVDTATKLNTIGAELAALDGVHAMTDVTGFAVTGHLLEMCQGAGLGARLDFAKLPILPKGREYAEKGYKTGAGGRNWSSFGDSLDLAEGLADWQKNILLDPQTSGGLLVACAPGIAVKVETLFHDRGYAGAAIIGELAEGAPRVAVV